MIRQKAGEGRPSLNLKMIAGKARHLLVDEKLLAAEREDSLVDGRKNGRDFLGLLFCLVLGYLQLP